MPDVRMPDGTIVRNVPEGTTRQQLLARYNAAKPKSFWQGFGESIGTAANNAETALSSINPIMAAPRLIERAVTGRDNTNRVARFNAAEESKAQSRYRGSTAGRIVGGVAATLPTMGLSVPSSFLTSLSQGAAQSALLSEARTPQQFAKDVTVGSALNLVGDRVTRGLGNVIGGRKVPKNVRLLAEEGVNMTPGQLAGPRSVRQVIEDSVMGSIPGVREIPAAARRRAENDLRVAVANRVGKPIGLNVKRGAPMNSETMRPIQDQVYTAYNEAARNLAMNLDSTLEQGLGNIAQAAPRLAGPEGAQQVAANTGYVTDRLLQGELTGQQLVDTLNELRSAAASAKGETRSQLMAVYDEVADALARQNPSQNVSDFTNARESVALLKRMEDAAAKSVDGEFGPTQLLQAARRRGYGTSTANVANAEARMMDIANAAADVMRNTTPNSGTIPRHMATGALSGGLGGAGALGFVDPLAGAVLGGSLLGYVPGVSRILQNMALNRPQALRAVGSGVRAAAPMVGAGATAGLLPLFGQ